MDWKVDRIASAHRGENPMVIAKLKSGFAAIGDTQFLPGYCVLLPFKKVNTLISILKKDITKLGKSLVKNWNN